jgi:hypothetical protein
MFLPPHGGDADPEDGRLSHFRRSVQAINGLLSVRDSPAPCLGTRYPRIDGTDRARAADGVSGQRPPVATKMLKFWPQDIEIDRIQSLSELCSLENIVPDGSVRYRTQLIVFIILNYTFESLKHSTRLEPQSTFGIRKTARRSELQILHT